LHRETAQSGPGGKVVQRDSVTSGSPDEAFAEEGRLDGEDDRHFAKAEAL
jgi:hypothetical protein